VLVPPALVAFTEYVLAPGIADVVEQVLVVLVQFVQV